MFAVGLMLGGLIAATLLKNPSDLRKKVTHSVDFLTGNGFFQLLARSLIVGKKIRLRENDFVAKKRDCYAKHRAAFCPYD